MRIPTPGGRRRRRVPREGDIRACGGEDGEEDGEEGEERVAREEWTMEGAGLGRGGGRVGVSLLGVREGSSGGLLRGDPRGRGDAARDGRRAGVHFMHGSLRHRGGGLLEGVEGAHGVAVDPRDIPTGGQLGDASRG